MLPRSFWFIGFSILLFAGCGRQLAQASQASTSKPEVLQIDGLGRGSIPLDGQWQFHLGDNPAWASPDFDDSTGQQGWEQITADAPWGAQTHPNTFGFAWYRRHLSLIDAPGAARGHASSMALLLGQIDDAYEVYWNGQLVGHLGSLPPHLETYANQPPQTLGLGPAGSGVLAIRVYKAPFESSDDGAAGGLNAPPVLGSPQAIRDLKGRLDFEWLRGRQFRFGLTSLYVIVGLIGLASWLRDRSQPLLFWLTIYSFTPLGELVLGGLRLPLASGAMEGLRLSVIAAREISLWFLLLYLLGLGGQNRITRLTRALAILCFASVVTDSLLIYLAPKLDMSPSLNMGLDAAFTALYVPVQFLVAVIVIAAFRRDKKLDSTRKIVASFAFLNSVLYLVVNLGSQGSRFTHWTWAGWLGVPIFSVAGNAFTLSLILRTLLFISIIYAVARYAIDAARRRNALEREFQNARELQRVLIPETIPRIPSYALTSAYKPAREVGGDFFQIIPLANGSTLVVLGDVSGKGLRAAMAVSLIVGAVRMAAEGTSSPATILGALNRRLHGRLQGGFTTCLVMRLDPDGACVVASAGHPAPFLNDSELALTSALPLGIDAHSTYEETVCTLSPSDHLALYTDGLLEARSPTGELYSFARLQMLFAGRPTADQAAQAAVDFGQDDDITVLTLTRQEPAPAHA